MCEKLNFYINCTNVKKGRKNYLDCLSKLWKIYGCTELGSEFPNNNNLHNYQYYSDFIENIKFLKKKAFLGDEDSFIKCINKDYKKTKLCDKSPIYINGIGYHKTGCLQHLWKKYGCSKEGMKYPGSILINYKKCKSNKCNIISSNKDEDICWENCNDQELKNQLIQLNILAKSKDKNAQLKCFGKIEE